MAPAGAIFMCPREAIVAARALPRVGIVFIPGGPVLRRRFGRSIRGAHSAGGATGWSRNPARSSARRTLPDALACSRNALT
jgi:hypothetical protein